MLIAEIQYGEVSLEHFPCDQVQHWLDCCFNQDRSAQPLTLVVRIASKAESQSLNHNFRGKNRPTNVLSFPFEAPAEIQVNHLGDLVICAALVEQEAAEQGKSVTDHFAHLVVHGVLHLQGFDHISQADAEEMESLEVELLQRIDVPDPYTSPQNL